jgi:hypothetical protein
MSAGAGITFFDRDFPPFTPESRHGIFATLICPAKNIYQHPSQPIKYHGK